MSLLDTLAGSTWQNLASTLLHSLWQGALIASGLYLFLKSLVTTSPQRRYLAALVAQCLLVGTVFLTWAVLDFSSSRSTTSEPSTATTSPSTTLTTPRVAQIESTESESPIPSHGFSVTHNARVYLLIVWGCGVLLMLFRLLTALSSVQEIRQQSRVVHDTRIDRILTRLAEQLRRSLHHVRIHSHDLLSSPAVIGVLRPTIILPTAILAQTDVTLLQAIIAHEVAHIRRHDYLINLAQLVIETLLFFNPAVWWLNQQIRIEREACCDATAAKLIGDRTRYAEALADFAATTQAFAPTPALNFGAPEQPNGLIDRVKRLLNPAYHPRLRLPLPALISFCLVSTVALISLHQGSRLAVAVGAELMSPEERIAKIESIQESHPTFDPELHIDPKLADLPESRVTLAGRITTADGSELIDTDLRLVAHTERHNHGGTKSLGHSGSTFRTTIQPGEIHLAGSSPHYAPALVGPLHGRAQASFTNLVLEFQSGFDAHVRVLDSDRQPIANAVIKGQYDFPCYAPVSEATTNSDGIAILQHSLAHAAKLKVRAKGFQEAFQTIDLSAEQIGEIELQSAAPSVITLRDLGGNPIVGGEAFLLSMVGNQQNRSNGKNSRARYAISDSNGELHFTDLRDGTRYWFTVRADGYAHGLINDLSPGETPRTLTLGPPRKISCVLVGDLSQLITRPKRTSEGDHELRPTIQYSNPVRTANYDESGFETLFIEVADNESRFEITDLFPGTVTIQAGHTSQTIELEEGTNQVRLELSSLSEVAENSVPIDAALPRRTVVFQFNTPPHQPIATGKVSVDVSEKQTNGNYAYAERQLDIIEGKASLTVNAGSRVSIEPSAFTGYWFQSHDEHDIAEGGTPLTVPVECVPAGAIYGDITEPDGKPARGIMISVVEVERAPNRPNASLNVDIKSGSSSSDQTRRFTATPLPLGGTYRIVAHRGKNYSVSPILAINEQTPLQEIKLVMQPGVTIQGQFLRPDGEPARNIRFTHNYRVQPNYGFSDSDQQTDRLGRFTLSDVVADLPGTYAIIANENPGYQRVVVDYDPKQGNLQIPLLAGHTLTGTVVDDETGWPIPGVEVYATPYPYSQERYHYVNADALTDDEGRFLFTTLDDQTHRIGIRSGRIISDPNQTYTSARPPTAPIRITLSEWSKLKPVPPPHELSRD